METYHLHYDHIIITIKAKSLLAAKREATSRFGGSNKQVVIHDDDDQPICRRRRWDGFNMWGLHPWVKVEY